MDRKDKIDARSFLPVLEAQARLPGDDHKRNERRTWFVISLTATMVMVKIIAGTLFGLMALVPDG